MDDDLRRSAQEPLCRICCTDGATSHPEPRSPSWAILGPLHSPYAQHGWYPRRSLGQGGETNRFKGCYTGVTGWGGCGSHPYFPPPGGGEIRVFMGLVWGLHSSTLLPTLTTATPAHQGRRGRRACDVCGDLRVCGGEHCPSNFCEVRWSCPTYTFTSGDLTHLPKQQLAEWHTSCSTRARAPRRGGCRCASQPT